MSIAVQGWPQATRLTGIENNSRRIRASWSMPTWWVRCHTWVPNMDRKLPMICRVARNTFLRKSWWKSRISASEEACPAQGPTPSTRKTVTMTAWHTSRKCRRRASSIRQTTKHRPLMVIRFTEAVQKIQPLTSRRMARGIRMWGLVHRLPWAGSSRRPRQVIQATLRAVRRRVDPSQRTVYERVNCSRRKPCRKAKGQRAGRMKQWAKMRSPIQISMNCPGRSSWKRNTWR